MDERPRWLVGLRRAVVEGSALDRWTDDRGVTGVAFVPGAWVPGDAGPALVNLVSSGARPDRDLLWDLAVSDIRGATEALRYRHRASDGGDGYVAVWMDPDRLTDPGKAGAAAREVVNEVKAENLAVAFVWTGARAGAVSAIVAAGVPVAVSGADDRGAQDNVHTALTKGMERRRAKAEEDEDPEEVADVPVFLLGASEARDGLVAVELTEEFGLVAPGRGPGLRLPQTPADEQAAWTSGVSAVAERAKRPAHDDAYGSLAGPVDTRCRALEREDICERIWARDHTVWREEPAEITDRLGWLDVAWRMRDEAADLQSWADDVRRQGVSQVVLCGMGGSSLAPEMFRAICGGSIPLTVLDSTHPDHVAAVTSSLDPDRTLVIVSSKSGTTVETRSHLEHLWAASGRADRFVAITDPGSQLAEVARARGFRRTFENPADIGGRYSALSYFGLVPAAVCGIDVAELCDGAIRSALACAPSVDARRSVGARLGVAIGEAWAVDQDKLTLVLPQALRPLGDWIEQLIAESLGKDDTGIVPVVGEDLGPPDVYRDDRLLVAYAIGDEPFGEELDALESDGHPVVRLVVADASPATVGAECFRWEFATAVAGCVIDVQPFDQPDVEAAKQRAREALERPGEPPKASSVDEVLGALEAEDGPSYLALQAFLPPTAEHARMLQAARMKLRDRLRVATTVGFGPRFLHSTGQLHKGGLPGACIQVTGPRSTDVDVPEAGYTFGRLLEAQADGDLQALLDRNRLVARVSLDELGAL